MPRQRFLIAIGGVFAAMVSSFVTLGAVLPILPRYVHGPIGAGDVAVGVAVGAFAVTAIVARPWAGRLADERGRRLVLVWGTLLAAAGGALLLVPAGVPGVVLSRLVYGAGEAFVFTAGTAWVVDIAPLDRRGQAIGLVGVSVWGGISIGPAIGELLLSVGGFEAVWAFAALAPLTGAAIALRLPAPAPRPREADAERPPLLVREAIGPGIPLALTNASYAVLAGFVVLHLEARGSGHGALVFTAFAVAMVATRIGLGRIPDRWGARRSAVSACVGESVGVAIVAVAGGWQVALLGAVVMGVAFALLYPALAVVVVERVPEERRGAALGSLTAFYDAGFGVGGPLAGAVAGLWSYEAAFWTAAVYSLAAAAAAARATRRTPVATLS